MFRLKDNRYFQISNRLAMMAGLVLAVTALAGLPRADAPAQQGSQVDSPITQTADAQLETVDPAPKPKWTVRFLLFRHG